MSISNDYFEAAERLFPNYNINHRAAALRNIREYSALTEDDLISLDLIGFAEANINKMSLKFNTTEPIELLDCQRDILKFINKHDRPVVVTSRQCGSTTSLVLYAVYEALKSPNQRIRMSANRVHEAEHLLYYIPLLTDNHISLTRRTITFRNGSVIMATPFNEDAMRGTSLTHLIVDNASFVSKLKETLKSAEPCIRPHGKVILLSAPSTTNSPFFEEARNGAFGIGGRATLTVPIARNQLCRGKINELQSLLSPTQFSQEFECQFTHK